MIPSLYHVFSHQRKVTLAGENKEEQHNKEKEVEEEVDGKEKEYYQYSNCKGNIKAIYMIVNS